MKKLFASLLTASLMLLGTQAFAQIAVGGGYLNATEKAKVGGVSSSLDLNGVYAGASINFSLDGLVDGLGVAPGAYLDLLFGKQDDGWKHRDISLQVPVNFNYGYELTDDFKVFGFAGPILHLGLIKKESYKANGGTTTYNYYNDDYANDLGRFNLLLGLGAGIEVSEMFQVVVGFDFGLLNMDGDSGYTYRRPTQIKIGVNYLL